MMSEILVELKSYTDTLVLSPENGHVLALLVVAQIIVDKNIKRRYSCNKHLIINAYGSEF